MKTSFVKIIHPQGEKRIQEILQSPLHPLHPPKHAVCGSSLVLGSLCAPCRPSVSLLLLLDIFFSIIRGDLCADCQKDFFFFQPHWLVFSSTVLSTWQLLCKPWDVLPWAKQPTKCPSKAAHWYPPPALPCHCNGCSFVWSSQVTAAVLVLASCPLYQLELPASMRWIMAYNEDIQLWAPTDQKQWEKTLVLFYQFIYPLPQC